MMMMRRRRNEGDDTDDDDDGADNDDGADIDGDGDDPQVVHPAKTTNLEKKSRETAALYLRQKYPIRAECRRRKVTP